MNLARAVQVSMDTAVQPCEDRKSHLVDFVGRRVVLWVFSGAVSRNPRVVFARGGIDVGVVIVFAMAWGGPVLVVFEARFAGVGQCGQHGIRWKGH